MLENDKGMKSTLNFYITKRPKDQTTIGVEIVYVFREGYGAF